MQNLIHPYDEIPSARNVAPAAAHASENRRGLMAAQRILIVDHEPAVALALAEALSADGFEILTADDGGGAVSIARCEKPDLILLNTTFPPDVAHGGGIAWDGFLILAWLRRLEEAKGTPVIFMTESDTAQYAQRARASGAVGLFHKTQHRAALLDNVRRILARRAAE